MATPCLTLTNSGPGLAEECQSQVFERFFRGANQRGGTEGSGLGLSIAQWIMQPAGLSFTRSPD